MTAKSLKPLRETQRIRVLIDGLGVYCRVGDIASAPILAIAQRINEERAKGNPCVGLVGHCDTTKGYVNIQIDVL